VALITMDDNGGLPIKCSATSSRVTHGSLRFRKYVRAARPVSANEQSCTQSAESCKSVGTIHQGNNDKLSHFASEITNNKMCNSLSFKCIGYPGWSSFTRFQIYN